MNAISSSIIPADLKAAQKLIYAPCGLVISDLEKEAESADYSALTFHLNAKSIKFRAAKITPTKNGQFVTFWKRIGNGPIQPHESSDAFDLFVVSVRLGERMGQFVFPKSILQAKGVITHNGVEGKRALRVYPSWVITDSIQAKKTQAWQLPYFFEIDVNQGLDIARIQSLF